jgi:hypothetical protein
MSLSVLEIGKRDGALVSPLNARHFSYYVMQAILLLLRESSVHVRANVQKESFVTS